MSAETPDQRQGDLIDLLTEGSQRIEEIPQPDGSIKKVLVSDPEVTYWSTRIVNSPTFSRFVFEVKNFERLSNQARNNMSKGRALILGQQINEIVSAYKYSVDGKSSESVKSDGTVRATLIDKLNKITIDKNYSMKENVKKGMMASIFGKDEKDDSV